MERYTDGAVVALHKLDSISKSLCKDVGLTLRFFMFYVLFAILSHEGVLML